MQRGLRVTDKAPVVPLANTVGCVVVLTSESPFLQEKSVLGQKMPQISTTLIGSTQKTTLHVLDSAFITFIHLSIHHLSQPASQPCVCPWAQRSLPSTRSLTHSVPIGSRAFVSGCVVALDL